MVVLLSYDSCLIYMWTYGPIQIMIRLMVMIINSNTVAV